MGQISFIILACSSNMSRTEPREASRVTAEAPRDLSSEYCRVALAQDWRYLPAQISVAGPDRQNWLRSPRTTPASQTQGWQGKGIPSIEHGLSPVEVGKGLGDLERAWKLAHLSQPCWPVRLKAAALPGTLPGMVAQEHCTYSITGKIVIWIQLVSKQNSLLGWTCPQ